MFIQQYEEIIDVIQSDDNDELLDKLQFKKSLLPIKWFVFTELNSLENLFKFNKLLNQQTWVVM